MNWIPRLPSLPSLALIGSALLFGAGVPAAADDGHKHGAPLHGGKVAMTDEYHFEAVFTKDGLKVYPRTHEDKPLDTAKLAGTATFYHPTAPKKPWFEQKLTPPAAKAGEASSSLSASVDLSKVPATGTTVTFKIRGLPEAAQPEATFTVPFALTKVDELVVAKATSADDKAVAAQKTCPVSKESLADMGGPFKVSRGDKSVFICCKSCLKDVQADPDKFLGSTKAAGSAKAKDGHQDHAH